jgi:hypothetical protein
MPFCRLGRGFIKVWFVVRESSIQLFIEKIEAVRLELAVLF